LKRQTGVILLAMKKSGSGLPGRAQGLRVKWPGLALDDLDSAIEYIARENPRAAQDVALRIWESGESLADNPETGWPGRIPGSRENVVNQTPCLLAYRIKR